MIDFNKVFLIGLLESEPRLIASGNQPVTTAVLVNKRKWTKRELDGDLVEHQEIVPVEMISYGALAETIQKHAHKGDTVLVEGKLRRDGNRLCVQATFFQILDESQSN